MDHESERERATHALAEAWQVISVLVPLLRAHVKDDEGHAIVNGLEEACRRSRAAFEQLRKVI